MDFETVKQLRKSLLITSVIGIAISYMIEYSTGCVSFFGFTFATSGKVSIISKLLGCIVFYFWISFIIKFWKDELPKIYKKRINKELDDWFGYGNNPDKENLKKEIEEKVKKDMRHHFKSSERLIKTIDIYFPIALGIYSMVVCFRGAIVLF
ncbi:hypothetical protein [Flagellimonas aequoris]|uniref:DUF3899 domain-containing protein n=2 Tax=Flagellimonas aequoris TaxID=2306997 RepID=A0A418N4F3_9FLAO|nr:hypothetical protein [Allomuricauda aequoris]RIV68771.1 hypothetical protein D2U88_16440 [Allomuricauda aequoris]